MDKGAGHGALSPLSRVGARRAGPTPTVGLALAAGGLPLGVQVATSPTSPSRTIAAAATVVLTVGVLSLLQAKVALNLLDQGSIRVSPLLQLLAATTMWAVTLSLMLVPSTSTLTTTLLAGTTAYLLALAARDPDEARRGFALHTQPRAPRLAQ